MYLSISNWLYTCETLTFVSSIRIVYSSWLYEYDINHMINAILKQ